MSSNQRKNSNHNNHRNNSSPSNQQQQSQPANNNSNSNKQQHGKRPSYRPKYNQQGGGGGSNNSGGGGGNNQRYHNHANHPNSGGRQHSGSPNPGGGGKKQRGPSQSPGRSPAHRPQNQRRQDRSYNRAAHQGHTHAQQAQGYDEHGQAYHHQSHGQSQAQRFKMQQKGGGQRDSRSGYSQHAQSHPQSGRGNGHTQQSTHANSNYQQRRSPAGHTTRSGHHHPHATQPHPQQQHPAAHQMYDDSTSPPPGLNGGDPNNPLPPNRYRPNDTNNSERNRNWRNRPAPAPLDTGNDYYDPSEHAHPTHAQYPRPEHAQHAHAGHGYPEVATTSPAFHPSRAPKHSPLISAQTPGSDTSSSHQRPAAAASSTDRSEREQPQPREREVSKSTDKEPKDNPHQGIYVYNALYADKAHGGQGLSPSIAFPVIEQCLGLDKGTKDTLPDESRLRKKYPISWLLGVGENIEQPPNNPTDDIPESVRFLNTITAAGHRWRAHQARLNPNAPPVQQSPRFGMVPTPVVTTHTVTSDEARSWRKGSAEAKKEGKDEESAQKGEVDLPKIQTLRDGNEVNHEQKSEEAPNGMTKMLSAEEVENQLQSGAKGRSEQEREREREREEEDALDAELAAMSLQPQNITPPLRADPREFVEDDPNGPAWDKADDAGDEGDFSQDFVFGVIDKERDRKAFKQTGALPTDVKTISLEEYTRRKEEQKKAKEKGGAQAQANVQTADHPTRPPIPHAAAHGSAHGNAAAATAGQSSGNGYAVQPQYGHADAQLAEAMRVDRSLPVHQLPTKIRDIVIRLDEDIAKISAYINQVQLDKEQLNRYKRHLLKLIGRRRQYEQWWKAQQHKQSQGTVSIGLRGSGLGQLQHYKDYYSKQLEKMIASSQTDPKFATYVEYYRQKLQAVAQRERELLKLEAEKQAGKGQPPTVATTEGNAEGSPTTIQNQNQAEKPTHDEPRARPQPTQPTPAQPTQATAAVPTQRAQQQQPQQPATAMDVMTAPRAKHGPSLPQQTNLTDLTPHQPAQQNPASGGGDEDPFASLFDLDDLGYTTAQPVSDVPSRPTNMNLTQQPGNLTSLAHNPTNKPAPTVTRQPSTGTAAVDSMMLDYLGGGDERASSNPKPSSTAGDDGSNGPAAPTTTTTAAPTTKTQKAVSQQKQKLKAYIRQHALKYVKPPPAPTDRTYPQWYAGLRKVENIIYAKYMNKQRKRMEEQQQRVAAQSGQAPPPTQQQPPSHETPAMPARSPGGGPQHSPYANVPPQGSHGAYPPQGQYPGHPPYGGHHGAPRPPHSGHSPYAQHPQHAQYGHPHRPPHAQQQSPYHSAAKSPHGGHPSSHHGAHGAYGPPPHSQQSPPNAHAYGQPHGQYPPHGAPHGQSPYHASGQGQGQHHGAAPHPNASTHHMAHLNISQGGPQGQNQGGPGGPQGQAPMRSPPPGPQHHTLHAAPPHSQQSPPMYYAHGANGHAHAQGSPPISPMPNESKYGYPPQQQPPHGRHQSPPNPSHPGHPHGHGGHGAPHAGTGPQHHHHPGPAPHGAPQMGYGHGHPQAQAHHGQGGHGHGGHPGYHHASQQSPPNPSHGGHGGQVNTTTTSHGYTTYNTSSPPNPHYGGQGPPPPTGHPTGHASHGGHGGYPPQGGGQGGDQRSPPNAHPHQYAPHMPYGDEAQQ